MHWHYIIREQNNFDLPFKLNYWKIDISNPVCLFNMAQSVWFAILRDMVRTDWTNQQINFKYIYFSSISKQTITSSITHHSRVLFLETNQYWCHVRNHGHDPMTTGLRGRHINYSATLLSFQYRIEIQMRHLEGRGLYK